MGQSPAGQSKFLSSEELIPAYHANTSETMKGFIENDWQAGRARIMGKRSNWFSMRLAN